MVIQFFSDTHFEWHMDGGKGFTDALDPTGVDVLVLAGDIGSFQGRRKNNLMAGFHVMCRKYPHVLFVCGNHEFYFTDRAALIEAFGDFKADGHPNFHLLDCSTVEIEGQRFVGATMWFLDTPRTVAIRHQWADFIDIPGFTRWWTAESRRHLAFLKKEVRAGDVVVTHYAPSWSSADPRYATSATADFFVVDVSPLILRAAPRLWIHGHVHQSFDYLIDQTRVVCNPFGYPQMTPNHLFNANLTVSV